VGLEPGSLSLANTTEELLGRNSSGSGLESREYGRRDSSRRKKLALTSLTSCGHSVGIVRLRAEATELKLSKVVSKILQFLFLFPPPPPVGLPSFP
jgi:hypothetical protein